MPHNLGQGMYCAFDEPCTVIGRNYSNPSRKTRKQQPDFFFDPRSNRKGVFAIPHQNNTPDNFGAIFFENASAESGTYLNCCNCFHINGGAFHFFDDCVFDVFFSANPSYTPNDIFSVVFLNNAPACRLVRSRY